MQVSVRENKGDRARGVQKKRRQREGVGGELKVRQDLEKPAEKEAREKAEAIRRGRKLARKKAERENMM